MRYKSYLKNIDEEVLLKMAKEYKMTKADLKTICHFQWIILKRLQQECSFKTLMLPGWGKYTIKPGMKKRGMEIKKNREESKKAKEINKEQQFDYGN